MGRRSDKWVGLSGQTAPVDFSRPNPFEFFLFSKSFPFFLFLTTSPPRHCRRLTHKISSAEKIPTERKTKPAGQNKPATVLFLSHFRARQADSISFTHRRYHRSCLPYPPSSRETPSLNLALFKLVPSFPVCQRLARRLLGILPACPES